PAPALRNERRLKPRRLLVLCFTVIAFIVLPFLLPRSIALHACLYGQQKNCRPEARRCAFPRTAALLSARRWTRSARGWRLLFSSIQVPCQSGQKDIICCFYRHLRRKMSGRISRNGSDSLLISGATCRIFVQRNISGRS